ncbi:Hypothetical predicted protein [Octopus vulgaris]|uniref:Transmembrane protein n=1 Tax=Octopus vulgaris TaxID=6645 RepID=A0AA36B0N1_OCTVU|nr:Hypothetical predicted protein [Octopus vulgaris]
MTKGYYLALFLILIVCSTKIGVNAAETDKVSIGTGYCETVHQLSVKLHDFLGCKGGPGNHVTVPMMTFLVLLQIFGMYMSKLL